MHPAFLCALAFAVCWEIDHYDYFIGRIFIAEVAFKSPNVGSALKNTWHRLSCFCGNGVSGVLSG